MEVIGRAVECAALAGRMDEAARNYEEKAASLRRAAVKYRRGYLEALLGMKAGVTPLATESATPEVRRGVHAAPGGMR